MLRSTLKRNMLPIALIALGCLIFLAIVLYLFRSQMEAVGWVVLGLLMIGMGVLGIVATSPKNKNFAGDEPTTASQVSSETSPPPITSPGYPTADVWEATPGQQGKTTLSKPVLMGGGVFLAIIVLLLLCNLGTAFLPLFTVHETKIIDCGEASLYAEEGWRFVSTYSYHLEDAVSGDTVHTECVMEQERFVWARDKRTQKDEDTPEDERAAEDDASTDIFNPVPYVEPTWTSFVQPPATQMLPSPTPWIANSPLPTETPPPSSASLPTNTPLPLSPTPSQIPRTDIDVCEAASDDVYFNTYVQWKGVIVDDPTFEDKGLWFQVSWTNTNPDSACSEATFFVSYDSDERFFAEDTVLVTGTIINTNYEYEDDSGQTGYTVVVRADDVEFLDEP
jgi:hypothetical protein